MFKRGLGLAVPTWLEAWGTPNPATNIVRAFSINPQFVRHDDWPIDDKLDTTLEHIVAFGHSIICAYVGSNGAFIVLPHVWAAIYAPQPRLSELVQVIEAPAPSNGAFDALLKKVKGV